jgi:hypothetical protein
MYVLTGGTASGKDGKAKPAEDAEAALKAVPPPPIDLSATDKPLRAETRDGVPVEWHFGLGTVPSDAPTIVVGHEFFDALPVHQFQFSKARGWCERLVDIDNEYGPHHLKFVLSPGPSHASYHYMTTKGVRSDQWAASPFVPILPAGGGAEGGGSSAASKQMQSLLQEAVSPSATGSSAASSSAQTGPVLDGDPDIEARRAAAKSAVAGKTADQIRADARKAVEEMKAAAKEVPQTAAELDKAERAMIDRLMHDRPKHGDMIEV